MAPNGGTPRLLAKCGSAVEVLDKQQIEDPALARVKRARTTGHTDSLSAMAPHSSRHVSKRVGDDVSQHGSRNERPLARRLVGQAPPHAAIIRWPWLLVVCSAAPVPPVSARHCPAGIRDEVRTERHRLALRALI